MPISRIAFGGSYLLSETVITPKDVHRKYGISVQSFHRMRLAGLRGGIKPECYLRGSRWVTSEEAMIRFFDRVNAAARGERVDPGDPDTPSPPVARTASQRKAASERAAKECQALGV